MANSKATMGYPSRTAAVMAMRAEGMTLRQVAERLGITFQAVSALECSARRQAARLTVQVPGEIAIRLDAAARQRGMRQKELALRILEIVTGDSLIDAVLDDAV